MLNINKLKIKIKHFFRKRALKKAKRAKQQSDPQFQQALMRASMKMKTILKEEIEPKLYKASITRYDKKEQKNIEYEYTEIEHYKISNNTPIILLDFQDGSTISMVYDMLTIEEMK